jgi:tRNA threonylcarbamoyladenosine biosynthesis protein TsaB
MNIILFDSSTEACTIALKVDTQIYHFHEIAPRQHNKLMLVEIDKLLKSSGLTISDIDYIGYGVGPGSFVGVRLAAAITQGLAFPNDTPVVGFSSMHAYAISAYACYKKDKIMVIKDAKMGDLYIGIYSYDHKLNMLMVIEEYSIKVDIFTLIRQSDLYVGDGCNLVLDKLEQDKVGNELLYPIVKNMFPYIEYQISVGNYGDAISRQPVYLQGTSNWKKL